jgi:hypothetical protein
MLSRLLLLTGRYTSLAFRTARTFCQKRTVKWSAVGPAPDGTVRGLPLGVTACPGLSGVFADATILLPKSISRHHSKPAKTPRPLCNRYGARRATVRQPADQLHIIRHSQLLLAHELSRHRSVGIGSAER